MNRVEKHLRSIDATLQSQALEWVNRVRLHLGAKPLKKLPIKDAGNTISTTPIALAIWSLFEDDPTCTHEGWPDGAPGNIKLKVGGAYASVWEVNDAALGKELAQLFGTEYKSMKKREYCCHRHFDEAEMVVLLPEALREYESAVVEAGDAAWQCDCDWCN